MSVPSSRELHYKSLRDRYTHCTHVDGNLELTWLQNSTYDMSFLNHIREVSGYVLISHVDADIRMPNLKIIRGQNLFKLNVWNNEFGLFVAFSQSKTIEMPELAEISDGSVGMFNNYNLCHFRDIEWDDIMMGEKYFLNFWIFN
jgi:epidermal growth factor receptor